MEALASYAHELALYPVLRFSVVGVAKPGGSKRAFKHPSTGRIIVTEDSKNRPWRQEVAGAAAQAMGERPVFTGALAVEFTFHRPRPKGHYGSGRNAGMVKESAPGSPATRPDVLKLARAAEDACTGIVWRDDAQIVVEMLRKVWGEPERLDVAVVEL